MTSPSLPPPVADRLPTALLLLRLGVFVVMLMWTLDKFVQPGHAARVFERFYGLGGVGASLLRILAGLELALIITFVLGVAKRFTYGAVLLLHATSTLASYRKYLDPFNNLLFFAAWPMLAACIALYMLRDGDTRWVLRPPAAGSAGGGDPPKSWQVAPPSPSTERRGHLRFLSGAEGLTSIRDRSTFGPDGG